MGTGKEKHVTLNASGIPKYLPAGACVMVLTPGPGDPDFMSSDDESSQKARNLFLHGYIDDFLKAFGWEQELPIEKATKQTLRNSFEQKKSGYESNPKPSFAPGPKPGASEATSRTPTKQSALEKSFLNLSNPPTEVFRALDTAFSQGEKIKPALLKDIARTNKLDRLILFEVARSLGYVEVADDDMLGAIGRSFRCGHELSALWLVSQHPIIPYNLQDIWDSFSTDYLSVESQRSFNDILEAGKELDINRPEKNLVLSSPVTPTISSKWIHRLREQEEACGIHENHRQGLKKVKRRIVETLGGLDDHKIALTIRFIPHDAADKLL